MPLIVSPTPYTKLALIYDHVMKHVDYKGWALYIASVMKKNKIKDNSILELACGTGSLARILTQKKHKVTGLDLSHAMLVKARQKNGTHTHFVQGTLTSLPFKKKFNTIICLYDSINYLMQENDIRHFLDNIKKLLSPNGICIFDICTETNSLRFFSHHFEAEQLENIYYERESNYDKKNRIQRNNFTIVVKNKGRIYTYEEAHKQRIYSPKKIEQLILETRSFTSTTYDGFTFDPPTKQTSRVHFVLRLRSK